MALVSVTLFTACSSDDDAVTPVFPQVQTIGGAAGAELDFTFDANESWSLSSDKIWCKLVQGEKADAFVLNGTAGKQTIKVKITADDASKDMSVAQLFLNMGGQKVAIAEVKRSAADHILTVYDADGNDITKTGITVGYNVYTKFTVKSNFRFAVTNMPNWVELDGGFMVGRPQEAVVGGAMFKEGVKNAKYAIAKAEGEFITFASEDGKAEVSVPVIYNGMPTNTMDVSYPTSAPWADWTVSLDGKTFSQTSTTGVTGEETTNKFTFSNFVPFTLKTAADDYTLVVFKVQSWGLEPVYERFVKTTGEGGNIRLAIDALESGERECYVYALPTAEYEALGNPEKMIDEDNPNAVSWLYNKFFLMHFIQKEQKAEDGDNTSAAPSIKIMNYLDVECTKDVNGKYKEVASSSLNYNGDEIYVASAEVGSSLTVNPNIKDWDPTTMMETGYLYMIGSDGKEIVPEPSGENGNWVFSFRLPETAPVFMAFQDHGKVVKVLVIEPTYNQSKKHTSIRKIRK